MQHAVNLAVHHIAIPDVLGAKPDAKKITQELCEFRRRMSDSVARQDKWWEYDTRTESMVVAVRDAASTFARIGCKLLNEATALNADLNTVSSADFANGKFNFMGFVSTKCRMALALAHLRKAQGQLNEAQAFATIALENAGSATLFKAQVLTLITQLDT